MFVRNLFGVFSPDCSGILYTSKVFIPLRYKDRTESGRICTGKDLGAAPQTKKNAKQKSLAFIFKI
jgi:hypothetical protein